MVETRFGKKQEGFVETGETEKLPMDAQLFLVAYQGKFGMFYKLQGTFKIDGVSMVVVEQSTDGTRNPKTGKLNVISKFNTSKGFEDKEKVGIPTDFETSRELDEIGMEHKEKFSVPSSSVELRWLKDEHDKYVIRAHVSI